MFVLLGVQRRFNRMLQTGQDAGAVVMQTVKSPRLDQGLQRAPIDELFFHPQTKIEKTGKSAVGLALRHDGLNRCLPCAFDRAQTIADVACIGRHERVKRLVDIGRQDDELIQTNAVFIKNLHLVGVIHVRGHGGGHELCWIIRFEPRGLISDQGIRRRVGFIKTVIRKFFHQVEQLRRHFNLNPMHLCTFGKHIALTRHLRRIFFTHRTAQ